MDCYKLEIRQIVDYPRCRIYREFIQTLIADRSIRTGGSSGLFYFTVLCSYANFRTSYRRLDGITYTIYPRRMAMPGLRTFPVVPNPFPASGFSYPLHATGAGPYSLY